MGCGALAPRYDLAATDAFASVTEAPKAEFDARMDACLRTLTAEFLAFVTEPCRATFFNVAPGVHAAFSPLTGLNHASLISDKDRRARMPFRYGGFQLSRPIEDFVSYTCGMRAGTVPEYAILTGNTEQRYLSLFFIREYERMLRAVVRTDVRTAEASGSGLLHDLLESLPKHLNLLQLSTSSIQSEKSNEHALVEFIAHWADESEPVPASDIEKRALFERMTTALETAVRSARTQETSPGVFEPVLLLEECSTPEVVYPRVFVSYSTREAEDELQLLQDKLREGGFHPVLGTDFGQVPPPQARGADAVTEDVLKAAFRAIDSCFAFVSLQVRRSDFAIPSSTATESPRYVLPPWAVAEEVYAWSTRKGILLRIRDKDIEDPRYNRNTPTEVFTDGASYAKAVDKIVEKLRAFVGQRNFRAAQRRARWSEYPAWPDGPSDED